MHNIKSIRENPDFYKKKLEERNLKVNFKDLLDLDKKNRETIQKKEKYEQERKSISKKKDEAQFAKSKKISKEIKSLEESQESLRKKINEILNFLPNIALDDVPVGKDDKFNKDSSVSIIELTKDILSEISKVSSASCFFSAGIFRFDTTISQ